MVDGSVRGQENLVGRVSECALLDDFVASVRAGESRTLLVHGEAGIGKTALLGYVAATASDMRLLRAAGVESEMELPYASLHQLCAPLLDAVGELPAPQRNALEVAFGQAAGSPPDRFLVGLAVLTLLSSTAEKRPVLCIVDDAQWLDEASAKALTFVARRLLAEPVGVLLAVRELDGDLRGLPELEIRGLRIADAKVLLEAAVMAPLDERVRDRIVIETRGNPLALLELPHGLTIDQLAGGFGLSGAPQDALSSRLEEGFRRRIEVVPAEAQLLMIVAAADPLGDPVLVRNASELLGIDVALVHMTDGLLTIEDTVTFRHPVVRSAVYRLATPEHRRTAHSALADVTDPAVDPDRRAWHLAAAALGPDESVAEELERCAGRARARGGVAAAAAFLQRALGLTADANLRAGRAIAAAELSFQAGALETAQRLLVLMESSSPDGLQAARASLLRGHMATVTGYGADAAPLLLRAAKELEAFDLNLARSAYLTAYGSAMSAGHLAQPGVLLEICRAIENLPPPAETPAGKGLLLEGLARMHTDGRAHATPILKRARSALLHISADDVLQWGWMAPVASHATWDSRGSTEIFERQANIARASGALAELPMYLISLAGDRVWTGDLAAARHLIAESDAVAAMTGGQLPPFATLRLLATEGREAEATALISATIALGNSRGQGLAVRAAQWAAAVLYNGIGRYEEAAAAAREVTANDIDYYALMWALPELVEASTRIGESHSALAALDRLTELTQPAGTDWALGTEARCRALLSESEDADRLYREATERFGRTRLGPDLARSHLLYGEWLRREGSRIDAREQLRTAHEMFEVMGMEGFAERSRRELVATGETVRKRNPETRDQLTPQEAQVARLARDGLSNTEIGAQLFLSTRTVEWHLRKVYAKLQIRSRRQLSGALPSDALPSPLRAGGARTA